MGRKVYELTEEDAALKFEAEVIRDLKLRDPGAAGLFALMLRCHHNVVNRVIIHGMARYLVPPGTVYEVCAVCGSSVPPDNTLADRLRFIRKPNRVIIHGGNDERYAHLAGTVYPTPY